MNGNIHLKYADERDKSYGVAGMAIAVVAYDCEDMLASVSIDAAPGHNLEFGNEMAFNGNPRLSAKLAWNELLKHYRLATGLLVANAMSRHYVQHRRRLPGETQRALHDVLHTCGAADEVQLDADEVDEVLTSNYQFFDRLFQMQVVHDATHRLASDLVAQRTLSAAEVLDRLAAMMRVL
ncbi:MAG: hypothetical protein K2L74_05650 [Muribaculaceae bacterium]|nr:hypothetical protein [Muribaculaceae bacterium]MDE6541476.1 hypothetical protein [Muribaculaceae bacterium]